MDIFNIITVLIGLVLSAISTFLAYVAIKLQIQSDMNQPTPTGCYTYIPNNDVITDANNRTKAKILYIIILISFFASVIFPIILNYENIPSPESNNIIPGLATIVSILFYGFNTAAKAFIIFLIPSTVISIIKHITVKYSRFRFLTIITQSCLVLVNIVLAILIFTKLNYLEHMLVSTSSEVTLYSILLIFDKTIFLGSPLFFLMEIYIIGKPIFINEGKSQLLGVNLKQISSIFLPLVLNSLLVAYWVYILNIFS